MNYNNMSLSNLNQFGRRKYKSNSQVETALNAGIARNIIPNTAITQTILEEYGPFTRFHFENKNSTITIQLDIGGQALGDNSIQQSKRTVFILPSTAVDILPDEDNLIFTMVSIKNIHAVDNTSSTDLTWDLGNY